MDYGETCNDWDGDDGGGGHVDNGSNGDVVMVAMVVVVLVVVILTRHVDLRPTPPKVINPLLPLDLSAYR